MKKCGMRSALYSQNGAVGPALMWLDFERSYPLSNNQIAGQVTMIAALNSRRAKKLASSYTTVRCKSPPECLRPRFPAAKLALSRCGQAAGRYVPRAHDGAARISGVAACELLER